MTNTQAAALVREFCRLWEVTLAVNVVCLDTDSLNAVDDQPCHGDTDGWWKGCYGVIRLAMRRSDTELVDTILHEVLHLVDAELEQRTQETLERLSPGERELAGASLSCCRERRVRLVAKRWSAQAMRVWREVKREVA